MNSYLGEYSYLDRLVGFVNSKQEEINLKK